MASDSEGGYELDDVDRKIIAVLKADGRATNQQIASSLKIAAATVSLRIRRMEELNAMRVVAVTDLQRSATRCCLRSGSR
jgi:DNA-binding Lrp family transcriptional regulator